MIRVFKSASVPDSLLTTTSYNGEDVIKQLSSDQHDKCYLCERVTVTDFEVEHLRSKSHSSDKTKAWSNLFLSCSYCNKKKSSNYDTILDPTQNDIEKMIGHSINYQDKKAVFTGDPSDDSVKKTIELLSRIHNGTGRYRTIREENFFNHLLSRMNNFRMVVNDYLESPSPENQAAVEELLDIKSEFLGFKYHIIMGNKTLKAAFAHLCVWNKTA